MDQEAFAQEVSNFLKEQLGNSPIRHEIAQFLVSKWQDSGCPEKVQVEPWQVYQHLHERYQEVEQNHPLKQYSRLEYPIRGGKPHEADESRRWFKSHLKHLASSISSQEAQSLFLIKLTASGIRGPIEFSVTPLIQVGPSSARPEETKIHVSRAWMYAGSLLIFAAAAILGFQFLPGQTLLAYAELQASTLVGFDQESRVIWRKELPYPVNAKMYAKEQQWNIRHLTQDLDNDGKKELVLCYNYKREGEERSQVIAYSNSGEQLWSQDIGKLLTTGTREQYNDTFRCTKIYALDADTDGNQELLVFGVHHLDYPSQTLYLSNQGEILGEYYTAGHPYTALPIDLDSDANQEILLGGTANASNQAFLIALDPRMIQGQAPLGKPDTEYYFTNVPSGTQLNCILFPRTDAGKLVNTRSRVSNITLDKDVIQVHVNELDKLSADVVYKLDKELNLVSVELYDGFWKARELMVAEGKLPGIDKEEYAFQLGNGVEVMGE